jgi:hypothetical protein
LEGEEEEEKKRVSKIKRRRNTQKNKTSRFRLSSYHNQQARTRSFLASHLVTSLALSVTSMLTSPTKWN